MDKKEEQAKKKKEEFFRNCRHTKIISHNDSYEKAMEDIANNSKGWMRDNEAWMCKIVVYSNESHEFFRLLLSADDVWITPRLSLSPVYWAVC